MNSGADARGRVSVLLRRLSWRNTWPLPQPGSYRAAWVGTSLGALYPRIQPIATNSRSRLEAVCRFGYKSLTDILFISEILQEVASSHMMGGGSSSTLIGSRAERRLEENIKIYTVFSYKMAVLKEGLPCAGRMQRLGISLITAAQEAISNVVSKTSRRRLGLSGRCQWFPTLVRSQSRLAEPSHVELMVS